MSIDQHRSFRRRLLLPFIVFVVVAGAMIAAAAALWHAASIRDADRFEAEVDRAVTALADRINTHEALLRGGAGLFAASASIDQRDFDAYVDRLGIGTRYPGVLGIGYSERAIGEAERRALVERMRAQGFEDFRVWPTEPRDVYHSILFLSPLNERNRAAIGYDMYTEPTRRAAMARARDDGSPAASGRVLLVQEIEPEKQPGFLIYAPVYRDGAIPGTVAARRRNLVGYVYSPLRAHDFLGTVFPRDEGQAIAVAVYAGAATPDNLLYRSSPSFNDSRLTAERTVRIGGRPWTIEVGSLPLFEAGSNRAYAYLALGLGLAVALLLAFATATTEQARHQLRRLNDTLERRVRARTNELTEANLHLTTEMDRREAAEGQVRQMQKMEAVGQLTGGIAHDFNNMLAVVIGSIDMARRRDGDPDRLKRLLDNAMEGATRAAALTQRLLAFSRRQSLSPEPVDANALIADMSELLRRTIGETIMLEIKLMDDAWRTFADAGQLENVLLNLAVNARDAMPDGGTLTLETSNCRFEQISQLPDPELALGDYIAIEVADTGQGMAPETLTRAFDPFFTTKAVGKGTGLGLSQVFGFVKQSGGHVGIRSAPGDGATVTLYLPRHSGTEQPTPRREPAQPGPLPAGSPEDVILVVEDQDQVRLMSVQALRDLGYTVLHAPDGAAALDMLESHPGVKLLFTDMVMPEMSGQQLAEETRKRWPDLKLLFTTGYDQEAVDAAGPAVETLSKPFTLSQLAAKVREVLDQPTHGSRDRAG